MIIYTIKSEIMIEMQCILTIAILQVQKLLINLKDLKLKGLSITIIEIS